MSIGFDEELQPYEEPQQDLNDIVLIGNKSEAVKTYHASLCQLATNVSLVVCS